MSPYLRAHADQPVDWFPWGDAAFARAREHDLPVFLSVGYAACHWCHVMARESFESPAIAAFLNAHFIPVKVDRQERPDIDALYLGAVQAMTGSGGWPLSVFLTPELQPFFGGTYFPPEDRGGLPGFLRVLTEITRLWHNDRRRLLDGARAVTTTLRQRRPTPGGASDPDLPTAAAEALVRSFDPQNGGFGGAPKFPPCMALEFLLRRAYRTGDQAWLRPCLLTLDRMALGGIRDHLGGGFHRYSVDAHWQVPHFEKMLYDNALLVPLYVAAWQLTGRAHYAEVVRETLAFLDGEMRTPAGVFAAALDADSEGEEGRFYTWTAEQVRGVLAADSEDFLQAYRLTPLPGGRGGAVLHRTGGVDAVPRTEASLRTARDRLLQARAARVRPALDDQVLTNWNGLALSAYARAAAGLGETNWLATARTLADALLNPLGSRGWLPHVQSADTGVVPGNLDDYAYLAQGLLDLYGADGDITHVKDAQALADAMLERFHSPAAQTFHLTEADRPHLIVRPTCETDDSLPAPAAVAAHVLLRLGGLTARPRYTEVARGVLGQLARVAANHPHALMAVLNALDDLESPAEEVVVAGPARAAGTDALLAAARSVWNPGRMLVQWEPGSAEGQQVAEVIPWVRDRKMLGANATAHVCRNRACLRPVTSAAELHRILRVSH